MNTGTVLCVGVLVGQDFSHLHIVQTGSGAHPAFYPMGTGGSFPGGEADHSPPTSSEIKNTGIYTSTPTPTPPHFN
jgi:hypothetical protein